MNNTNDIVIYGAGGLGRGIADLILSINKYNADKWNLIGFIDDYQDNTEINGLKLLGGIDYLLKYREKINVVLAFGSPEIKIKLYKELKPFKNFRFPNLIHPAVEYPSHFIIGEGNIVSKGVVFSSNIEVGNFNLIHYNCSIGHDVTIGNFNSIFPLSSLSGYVSISDSIQIGTNTSIIPSIKVDNNSIIGAGSTIINNIRKGSTVVGVPGKEISNIYESKQSKC